MQVYYCDISSLRRESFSSFSVFLMHYLSMDDAFGTATRGIGQLLKIQNFAHSSCKCARATGIILAKSEESRTCDVLLGKYKCYIYVCVCVLGRCRRTTKPRACASILMFVCISVRARARLSFRYDVKP